MFSTIIKGGKEFADVGSNVLRGVGIAAIIYVIYKEATVWATYFYSSSYYLPH